MKKSIKLLICILIAIFIILGSMPLVQASVIDSDIVGSWKPTPTGTNTKLTSFAGKILGIVQVFGSVASVIALVIIGIKYMLGSVSEKAKYKEIMIPYIVGCVMLFAISNIASVIYKFAINL